MKKKLMAALLALVMIVALAGCGGSKNETASADPAASGAEAPAVNPDAVPIGGTVTYAMAGPWNTLTPGYWCSTGYYGTMVWSELYDKLVNVESNGFSPRGAVSWSANEDKTVMTFKLDENAKFSDGEPVTAEDWVFSAKLMADPDFGAPDYTKFCVKLAGTDDTGLIDPAQEFGVKALDDYTLEIAFKEPMTFDTFFISYQHFYYVLPQHCFQGMDAAEIAASDFWQNPVCSGPWTVENHVVDSALTLKPNPYYHLGVAKLDNLVLTYMDASNFASALMSGSIDYCYPAVNADEADALSLVDSVKVVKSASPNNLWFFCVSNVKVHDVKVRQAINMAINKDLIADQLLNGGGVAVESVMLYGTDLYNTNLKGNYDPEGAKALLAEAGWDSNYVFKIATPSGIRAQIATIIQQNLEAIGMKVEVNQLDIGTMYSQMHGGNYDAIMGGGTPNLDPLFFQGNLEYTNINSSIVKTDDPTYHELAQKITMAPDEATKLALVMEYQQYMHDNMVTIPVIAQYSYMAYTSRLGGINPNYSVFYNDNTWEWYVAE